MQKLNTSLTPIPQENETTATISRDELLNQKLENIDQKAHKTLNAVETKSTQIKDAVSEYTQSKFVRLKDWYLGLDRIKQVAFSLLVIPLLLILFLLSGVIFPLISIIWPFLFMALNFTLIASKLLLFIVYISYKVMKTLMGIYYCISRTLSAKRANIVRAKMISMGIVHHENSPALLVDEHISKIEFQSQWKRIGMRILPSDVFFADLQNQLGLTEEDAIAKLKQSSFQLNFLLSYLRYFLLGQKALYLGLWQSKMAILTIWKAESREEIKKRLSLVGATIFTPHLLGAYLNKEQILVPGDFEFKALKLIKDEKQVGAYTLQIVGHVPWKSWVFNWQFPFAHSQDHQENWVIQIQLCLKEVLSLQAKATEKGEVLNLMMMQEEEGFDDDQIKANPEKNITESP